jgi:hypothetical protein
MDRILTQEIKHGCGVFDGSTGYIRLPSRTLDFTKGVTFEGWSRHDSFSQSWARILELGNTDGSGSNNIAVARNGITSNFSYYSRDSTPSTITVPNFFVLNQWVHVAVVHEGSGNVSIYKNGVVVFTGTMTLPQSIQRIHNFIGASSSLSNFSNILGSIDDVRIWNYARTAQQIKDNFNKVIKPQTGLVAYYKLDGNALDSSGNGFHGTMNGGVAWSSSVSPTLQKNIILQSSANRILTK